MSEAIPKATRRKFLLINALVHLSKPTIEDLHRETGISITALRRHISALRTEFKCDVRYVHPAGRSPADSGHYVLLSWGILDRKKFLGYFGSLKRDDRALDARDGVTREQG